MDAVANCYIPSRISPGGLQIRIILQEGTPISRSIIKIKRAASSMPGPLGDANHEFDRVASEREGNRSSLQLASFIECASQQESEPRGFRVLKATAGIEASLFENTKAKSRPRWGLRKRPDVSHGRRFVTPPCGRLLTSKEAAKQGHNFCGHQQEGPCSHGAVFVGVSKGTQTRGRGAARHSEAGLQHIQDYLFVGR